MCNKKNCNLGKESLTPYAPYVDEVINGDYLVRQTFYPYRCECGYWEHSPVDLFEEED